MNDIECPYCSHKQEIEQTDGYGQDVDSEELFEIQCDSCRSYYGFRSSILWCFEEEKVPCFNEGIECRISVIKKFINNGEHFSYKKAYKWCQEHDDSGVTAAPGTKYYLEDEQIRNHAESWEKVFKKYGGVK